MDEERTAPIENAERLATTPGRALALECIAAGIRAADPALAAKNALSVEGDTLSFDGHRYDLAAYDRVLVVGGGNAAGRAAAAVEDVLGDRIVDGAVVTDDSVETDRIRILPGDHPIPSDRGVESTRELLELADAAGEGDLVLTLVTGGGSALLAAPDGPSLEDLQATTDALLSSGATIHEINAVRKHLSAIKGGRLAERLAPATVAGVLYSDVVGDDPSVIASGPITPDASTYADALDVLSGYDVAVPEAVTERLRAGRRGERPETPTADADAFERVRTAIVASNATATAAAADVARDRGYAPLVLGSRLRGRAREVAKVLVGVAESAAAAGTPVEPPAVLVSGGETTVEVAGDGTGGPNHELATSAALELTDPSITLSAVDTDGIDGNAEAAGALVDARTVDDRREARAAIDDNDTAPYLSSVDAATRTGPTGTNVNDLHVVVVEDSSSVGDYEK